MRLMGERSWVAVSLTIVVLGMVPFFWAFERRRPGARELAILAALSGVAVAGRAAFFMVPQVKPVSAIVTIAGAAFGPQAGFLVGAVSALVSNFLFGQGPWTPWQMFGFGAIGALSGLLFYRRKAPRVALLCLYGGVAALVLYGGAVNLGTLATYSQVFTPEAMVGVFLAALPFDLVHAASTAAFLALGGGPLLDILTRVRRKYGVMAP